MAGAENQSTLLLLGHEQMDEIHQQLVELLAAIDDCRDTTVLTTRLDELIAHTQHHFDVEELWMVQSGYGHSAEHRSEHRRILGEMTMMRRRLRPATLPLVRAFLQQRLPEWLDQHLRGLDSTLAAHLASLEH